MLPGLNGTEILRRLRRSLPNVHVLVFSGYQDAHLLRELVEAGAHGFIGKTARATLLRPSRWKTVACSISSIVSFSKTAA